eukprot:4835542-Heterocapsa_arctica.AAC.1
MVVKRGADQVATTPTSTTGTMGVMFTVSSSRRSASTLANSHQIRLYQASLHHTVLVPITLPEAVAMFDTRRRYYDEHVSAQPANAPTI